MEKAPTPERTTARREEQKLSPAWEKAQAALAAESGLALLLVEGHQPPQLALSNNNSICHAFQSSPAHKHLCDPYCGEAYKRARSAGERTYYRCHAGLHCFATPVAARKGRTLAVIGGRAFLSAADYRALIERFRAGDLRELLSAELFRNVLFTTPDELDRLAARVEETAAEATTTISATKRESAEARQHVPSPRAGGAKEAEMADFFPSETTLGDACRQLLEELSASLNLGSTALLLRKGEGFTAVSATGKFKAGVPPLSFKDKGKGRAPSAVFDAGGELKPARVVCPQGEGGELFPLVVADEVKGALLVGLAADEALDEATRGRVEEFCRRVVVPLELLRLREELERRMRVAYHLQALTEQINSTDPDEAYATILRHSTELLRSERGSLLLFDEAANELEVKAAVGPGAKAAREAPRVTVGEGVAWRVLREGRPLVVRDLAAAGHSPAPAERKYKTGSFISYPLSVGGRKVGVLNVTDKASGGHYDDLDLNLLDMLAPQMALALDRAVWHQKATQFQLLSITDALTGLLNRRYIEERLGEEVERSKRHRFTMSFLMIDIDNFKDYNDRFGHPAGDRALELTAQCLKSALRSADIAARYGGEEFCVLLPQTNISEAHVIAERVRHRVEQMPYPQGQKPSGGAITVSIGISAFGPRLETPESIVRAADQALYTAKSRGKNRIEAYAPPATANPSPEIDGN